MKRPGSRKQETGSKKQEARSKKRKTRGLSSLRLWALGFGIWDLGFIIGHLSFVIALLWRPLFAGEAFFWGTPLLQFVPWQRMAAEMWRAGHLPLWNPLVGCGAPLAANYQAAAFYPLNALHLFLPAEVALSWTTVLHVALAGWGMYGWGRAVGLDRFPAFIGALAFSGSSFLVGRVALFPSMAFTFPWLAVWLWRAEALMRNRRPRNALWLGLSLGLGLLAGHAQTALYGGLMLAAYLVFRTLQQARRQESTRAGEQETERCIDPAHLGFGIWSLRFVISHFSWVILSLAIGLGLAAVQLLPTAELMSQSQRAAGVDTDFAMTYSLWPWRLITFAAPDFFGNPGRGDYWGYATYWEDAGYVGVLPLLLAAGVAIGRKRGRGVRWAGLVRFWAACAALTLVLALGKNTPVFPFLFRHVPSFNLFQAPARWLAITTIALAALAALGAQSWPSGQRGQRRGALWVTGGIALLLGGLVGPHLVPVMPSTFGPATARLGGTLAIAGALMLLRCSAAAWPKRIQSGSEDKAEAERATDSTAAWWQAAVGIFVGLDLLLAGWPLIPTIDRSLYRGATATAAALHEEPGPVRVYWPADPTHLNREYDAEQQAKFSYLAFKDFNPRDVSHWWEMREALLPNVGMLDGVACANNFDPLLVGRQVDMLEATIETPELLQLMGVTHVVSDRPWIDGEEIEGGGLKAATLYRLPRALGRAWVVPAARQVDAGEMLAALADPTFDPTAEVLLEQPISRAQSPASSIGYQMTLQDSPNRVTIRAALDAPGYLVLADTWSPGWRAAVDGEPAEVLRANYAFRAIWLDTGEHNVEMVYRPTVALVGAAISLTVLALLVAGVLLTCMREPQA